MAKLEKRLEGDMDMWMDRINDGLLASSASATYEDGTDYTLGGVRVAVRVYERYSAFGGNRVSLSMTFAGDGNGAMMTAITSGGSQAVWFKVNTVGERSFLSKLAEITGA